MNGMDNGQNPGLMAAALRGGAPQAQQMAAPQSAPMGGMPPQGGAGAPPQAGGMAQGAPVASGMPMGAPVGTTPAPPPMQAGGQMPPNFPP